MIERKKPLSARIGLFGVGHKTYWSQFEGLKDELLGYHKVLKERIERCVSGLEIFDYGITDNAETSYSLVKKLKAADLDLIFCNMLTYATSSTWGIIARELNIPIVLVAFQPVKAMDLDKACTYMQLANDNVCSMSEFTNVSIRIGKKAPPVIIGTLYDDEEADNEIKEWCRIARVLHDLKGARIALMGHVLEAMLDMHSDPTAFTAHFGIHIVQTEVEDVLLHYRTVTHEEMEEKKKQILNFFDTPEPVSDPITVKLKDSDLEMSARTAVALEKFANTNKLDGMAYYYEGLPDSEIRQLVTSFIVGNSLMCASGFPMCGELDLKTCVAMLIMDRLDIGGSFAEFHPIDFNEDFIFVGHDGPHHINVANEKPVLRSLLKYHGKPGFGASLEFKLKEGPITLLGITLKYDGSFKFVIAEGMSVAGKVPPTGNTNTRGYFKPNIKTFIRKWTAEGPTHHFALGIGKNAETIKKIGDVLGIESVIVTKI